MSARERGKNHRKILRKREEKRERASSPSGAARKDRKGGSFSPFPGLHLPSRPVQYSVLNRNTETNRPQNKLLNTEIRTEVFSPMLQDFSHLLWYDKPSPVWEEGLVIGNGSTGAVITDTQDASEEIIHLNHDTLWSGLPLKDPPRFPPSLLQEARLLIEKGRYAEASAFVSQNLLNGNDSASYQPAGRLIIRFPRRKNGKFLKYRRELDLRTALASSRCLFGEGADFRSESFASFPDKVLVFRYSNAAEKKTETLNLELSMSSGLLPFHLSHNGKDTLFLDSCCPYLNRFNRFCKTDESGRAGIRWRNALRAETRGGRISFSHPEEDGSSSSTTLRIENAESVTFYLCICTDFTDFRSMPGTGKALSPEDQAEKILSDASRLGYEALLERHLADYRALYERNRIELPASPEDGLPTDERLRRLEKNENAASASSSASPSTTTITTTNASSFSSFSSFSSSASGASSLCALLYHYGRYLLIASSRPGTQATNLQGIWNHQITPPWASNYTLNINTEMNYWHAESTALPECAEPLYELVEGLAETGRKTAENHYGCRGWCSHHNTDIWRYSDTASGAPLWAFWPMSGLWLCRHLFEHFEFSADEDFLRKYYPLMRGAADFICDFLVKNASGEYVTMPSTSPENAFIDPSSSEVAMTAFASTMDHTLIREHFHNLLRAVEILRLDEPESAHWRDVLLHLRRPGIGKHGELLEYGEPFEECDIQHRHLSHLYGIYPGEEFLSPDQEDLFEAARISLERRGDDSPGWALAWRIVLWARFHSGERAGKILKNFLRLIPADGTASHSGGGLYPNLLCAHPPFQIDGNFGICAAISEMLLQCCRRNAEGDPVLEILPALPPEWTAGAIYGLRAKHGITADLSWEGRQRKAVLSARNPLRTEIRFPGKSPIRAELSETPETFDF